MGPQHERLGLPNQDSGLYVNYPDLAVACVADGAGSLKRSDYGAELACNLFLEEALRKIEDSNSSLGEIVFDSLSFARKEIFKQDSYKELGCTFAGVIWKQDELAAIALGDAEIAVHFADGNHHGITELQNHEYANITNLLTSDSFNPHVFYTNEDILGVSIFSDGLSPVSIDANGIPLAGFWSPLLSRAFEEQLDIPALLDFLNGKHRIIDDTTLIMAVKGRDESF